MSQQLRRSETRPERLLVVAAHPHDADVAMAGSVARWVEEGTIAQLVCCTSGDGSADDAEADPLALAATREREQRAAASIVGYEGVTFLHRPDGAVANDLALREQLVRLIRSFRPDTVAAPDPRCFLHPWGAVNHVDHRETGAAALDAVQPAAANALAFPGLARSEGLTPHRVARLCLYWSEQPSHAVDIGATLERKARAVGTHASLPRRSQADASTVRAWAHTAAESLPVDAAETFALVDLA